MQEKKKIEINFRENETSLFSSILNIDRSDQRRLNLQIGGHYVYEFGGRKEG